MGGVRVGEKRVAFGVAVLNSDGVTGIDRN